MLKKGTQEAGLNDRTKCTSKTWVTSTLRSNTFSDSSKLFKNDEKCDKRSFRS